MKDISRLKKLAKIARKALSPMVRDNPLGEFDPDWACACAVCAWFVTHFLRKNGFPHASFALGLYDHYHHGFTVINDIVIDVSATQFERPAVVIEKLSKDSKYHVDVLNEDADEDLGNWPWEQRPEAYDEHLEAAQVRAKRLLFMRDSKITRKNQVQGKRLRTPRVQRVLRESAITCQV